MYVPAKAGDYLLLRHLGRGGMGSVYGAWDAVLHRAVAIKVMLPPEGEAIPDWATLEAEARSAARLNHPHVAQVYTFGYHNRQPFLVMELVRGHQLDEFITPGQPLDARFVFGVALQICEGLAQAAERNLLHSDIKPENIMIGPSGGAKLVDFGLAGTTGTGSAAGGKVVWGSPHYVAPERLQRKPATLRSDMYSLGATLYHVLAAKTPFSGGDPKTVMMARLTVTPESLRALRPDLPPEAEALVARMMAVEPGLRHPTYASLIGDLKRLLDLMGGEIDVSAYAAERFGGAAGPAKERRLPSRTPLRNTTSGRLRVSSRSTSGVSVLTTGRVATRSGIGWKLALGLVAGILFLAAMIFGAMWLVKNHQSMAAVPGPVARQVPTVP